MNPLVLQTFSYGLDFHNSEAWHTFSDALRAGTDREQRMALAIASLAACDHEDAATIVHEMFAGPPPPPFMSAVADASYWSDLASRDELRVYAAAIFKRLARADRRQFLRWAGSAA